MGTIGEDFTDGISECKCGCTDVVVEMTSYLFVKRDVEDGNIYVVDEREGDETDTKISCKDCEEVL